MDFIFFDAGGGHRSAAVALEAVIKQQRRPWTVRLVNLQEVLESLDIFKKITGIKLEDIYNRMLAKGWTLGSAYGLKFMQSIVRLYHRQQVRMLADHWRRTKPDMVVSLVPNFNRSLYEGLRLADPKTPFVTILTDMADYPPHFWIERNQDQWLLCGTARAVQQAKAMGHVDGRVIRTSGMILRPKFYEIITTKRDDERKRLGLDPNLPTGLVLFGGQGSTVMLEIARRVSASGHKVQLIFICGRNEELAAKLRSMKLEIPFHVVGFTSEVPSFMYLSDFLVGKPGPGSISEAIQMGIPVIIERNIMTLAQERFNADWVIDNQVGIVVKNFRGIGTAVGHMLAPGVLDKYKRNALAIQNRAVFEIPDILANIANI